MLIGKSSNKWFVSFAWYLAPVALAGLFRVYLVFIIVYRKEFNGQKLNYKFDGQPRIFRPLL